LHGIEQHSRPNLVANIDPTCPAEGLMSGVGRPSRALRDRLRVPHHGPQVRKQAAVRIGNEGGGAAQMKEVAGHTVSG